MKVIIIFLLSVKLFNAQVKDIFYYGSKVNDYIALNFIKSNEIELNINQIDSIFLYALALADSNIADALLFCSIGTMTYPTFKIKVPSLGFSIPFSVFTNVDTTMLLKKQQNLPNKLFEDSPKSEFGDKDKIVHFFSTAYLSYIFGDLFSNHFGYFVEEFEESFKVDGKIDKRDLKINKLGADFGKELRYKIIFPSFILAKEKRLSYGKNSDN